MAALIGGVAPLPGSGPIQTEDSIEVHLVRGLIHYDILLPNSPETREAFFWMSEQGVQLEHPNAEWIAFGWGSRAFYTSTGTYQDLRLNSVWQALTGDTSVLRVSLSGSLPENVHLRTVHLTPEQYTGLTQFITQSFKYREGTRALPIPGFTMYDRFFPARGRFHMFNTCNVWIGSALRAAGVRFGIWTPTPYAVSLSHWFWQTRK